MSGKRSIFSVILMVCTMMSACSFPAESPSYKAGGDSADIRDTGATTPLPSGHLSTKPVEYVQKTEKLPDVGTITSFPGVFETVGMTLEQIIKVLGTQFELKENKAQGYDSYVFPQYDLVLDFDRINKKLMTVRLEDVPYYVYSSVYKTEDLNDDGALEKIAAYEDQDFNGHLLVMDGSGGKTSDAVLDYFNGGCEVELLPVFGSGREALILVRTLGGKTGDVLKWSGGELKSVLPEELYDFSGGSMVTVEADRAVLMNKNKGLLYVCPIPERLAKSVKGRKNSDAYRFSVNLYPVTEDGFLYLNVRNSLQLKLADNYNFIDDTDGVFCDVAQTTLKYKYTGQGNWEEISIKGGPKYDDEHHAGAVTEEDLNIGGLRLYESAENLDKALKDELSLFTPEELNEGVLLNRAGMQLGITGDAITYLSLEGKSDTTASGALKISASREMALSLYGLPDKGFLEDRAWTYYIVSEQNTNGYLSVFIDTLNIEFDGDKVNRIWMSSYVSAY